jgi:hypothetical protein
MAPALHHGESRTSTSVGRRNGELRQECVQAFDAVHADTEDVVSLQHSEALMCST